MTRRTAVRRVGLTVLAVNAALAAAKVLVWATTGSLAVGSEAVNSLGDTAYSLVVVGGLYLTTRPPDREHPHGHERIEPFVSLLVAAGILAAGGLVLWRAATGVLSGGPPTRAGPAAVAVLAVAGVSKYVLYRHVKGVGESVNSPALVATALDNRVDVLTAAAALVGVIGARAGVAVLDPLAAGVVAAGVLYTGVDVVRDNVDYLVGRAPPADLERRIVSRARAHPDVHGVHDVVAHHVGPEVDVSLHVEVEGDRTLAEAHDIETAIVESIAALEAVDDVFVHVDPKELGEWKEGSATAVPAGGEVAADDDGEAESAGDGEAESPGDDSDRPRTRDGEGDEA